MWNDIDTGKYEGMIAETVTIPGDRPIRAYYSRPLTDGPTPGIVLVPHMPGWDEICREIARRFTAHGYAVVCPDIYRDFGSGDPAQVAVTAREAGGVPDKDVMDDCRGALNFLKTQPKANGKVGVIGTCSGGRHAFLAACTVEGFDAAVDCWGGGVVNDSPDAPVKKAADLSCPLLGIFGNDDKHPEPTEVDALEETLKELGKDYEFHRYDGAGHGFWYYHSPMYRQEQAMESWEKVYDVFEKHLR